MFPLLRRAVVRSLLAIGSSMTLGCTIMDPESEENGGDTSPQTPGIGFDPTSHHPVFDFDHWRQLMGIDKYLEGTCTVQLPKEFLSNDALREKIARDGFDFGKRVPVDLFFWSTLPPAKPWLTKYGGVPFRSKAKPWPNRNGTPATFIGQLCFRDSKDLFDWKLPGDLLTIFSTDKAVMGHCESHEEYPIIVEWETIDDIADPLTAGDDIHRGFKVPTLSGVRHRTFDYDYHEKDWKSLKEKLAGDMMTSVFSLPGTKIGPTYLAVQPGWDPREWQRLENDDNWRMVGTFYSVVLSRKLDWVVLDVKNTEHDGLIDRGFVMGDPGHLVLFAGKSRQARSYFIWG